MTPQDLDQDLISSILWAVIITGLIFMIAQHFGYVDSQNILFGNTYGTPSNLNF